MGRDDYDRKSSPLKESSQDAVWILAARSLLSPWLSFWLLAWGAKPVGGSPSHWALAGGGQQAEDGWATSLGTEDYGMHIEHGTSAGSALRNKLVPPQTQCATEAVGGKRISSSVRAVSLSSQVEDVRG